MVLLAQFFKYVQADRVLIGWIVLLHYALYYFSLFKTCKLLFTIITLTFKCIFVSWICNWRWLFNKGTCTMLALKGIHTFTLFLIIKKSTKPSTPLIIGSTISSGADATIIREFMHTWILFTSRRRRLYLSSAINCAWCTIRWVKLLVT